MHLGRAYAAPFSVVSMHFNKLVKLSWAILLCVSACKEHSFKYTTHFKSAMACKPQNICETVDLLPLAESGAHNIALWLATNQHVDPQYAMWCKLSNPKHLDLCP